MKNFDRRSYDKIMPAFKVSLSTKLSGLFLGMISFICILFIAFMTYPFNVIDIKEPINIINTNHQVEQGGMLYYKITMDKHIGVPGKIIRQLINDEIITYSPLIGNFPISKKKEHIVQLKIPDFASVGKYKMHWTGEYWILFRKIIETAESEEFEIIPNKKLESLYSDVLKSRQDIKDLQKHQIEATRVPNNKPKK